MFKKAALFITLMLLLPSLASAYTIIYKFGNGATFNNISGSTKITSGTGSVEVANGSSYDLYLNPTTAGYTVTKVVLDNTDVTSSLVTSGASQKLTIPYNPQISVRTVIVYFSTSGTQYVITKGASVGTGGVVLSRITGLGGDVISYSAGATLTVNANDWVRVSAVPVGPGAKVSGIAVTGQAGNSGLYTYDFQASGAATATVTFAADPVVLARLGSNLSRPFVGQSVLIDATASKSNIAGTNYAFAITGAPAGASLSGAAAQQRTFVATAPGVYEVTVTATNGAASSTAKITLTAVSADASSVTNVVTTVDLVNINQPCSNCHSGSNLQVVTNYAASSYYPATKCQNCHVGADLGQHPGVIGGPVAAGHDAKNLACSVCHAGAQVVLGDAHKVDTGVGCVDCHAVQKNAGAGFVQDNSGVRAIMGEFTKRSHHITGGTPTNAQCAVCHLEGKVVSGAVVTDFTKHMADNKIHLRNADTNTEYVWGGTEHTNMDNFCFSCHDSNGATGLAAAGLNAITGGSATNPFGDTLTNSYDQVARAGVVDVKTAFTTTNASHHAVSGQRYKYRFSTLLNAEEWATRTGNPVPAASEIAEGHNDLDGNPIDWTGLTYEPAGPEEGGEATLYEAGKFVSTYIPLGATLSVADNSTLHCGDCHTVGQWTANSSTNADGSATTVVIGAHGSANDYLLRNSEGTDALHNGRTYVCFNCHSASTPTNQEANTLTLWNELVAEGHINASTTVTTPYTNSNGLNPVSVPQNIPVTLVPSWKAGWNALHPTIIAGAIKGYATAHAVSAMHIQCEADSAEAITSIPDRGFNNFSSNRLQRSWAPQTVKAYDYLPALNATATAPTGGSNAASGNITGIACTNCHNSGLRNGFGGIHGGDNTYTDGLGRTQKSYRFMPGMGNYRYAPPGGWDGKDISDTTLLTGTNPLQNNGPANGSGSLGFPGASGKPMGGCYTNGGAGGAGSDLNNAGGVTYGVCNHHGTSVSAAAGVTGVARTTVTGNSVTLRATYGGGTTGTPTTYEPTVREATAGGTLVTRPLKY